MGEIIVWFPLSKKNWTVWEKRRLYASKNTFLTEDKEKFRKIAEMVGIFERSHMVAEKQSFECLKI